YSAGPQFFRALKHDGVKPMLLSLTVAVAGLAAAFTLSKLLNLDPGMSAGLVSGSLTHSSAIGTATDAIMNLALPPEQRKLLVNHIAIADALTYVFGAFGMIGFVSIVAAPTAGSPPFLWLVRLCDGYFDHLALGNGGPPRQAVGHGDLLFAPGGVGATGQHGDRLAGARFGQTESLLRDTGSLGSGQRPETGCCGREGWLHGGESLPGGEADHLVDHAAVSNPGEIEPDLAFRFELRRGRR